MKIKNILSTVLFFSMFCVSASHAEYFRNDFRRSGSIDAESLGVQDISIRAELLLEGIFNRLGDGWYTSSNDSTNHYLTNYFRYDSTNPNLKDQSWRDNWGQTLFLDVAFKPTNWVYAQFGFDFVMGYADRYWNTVNNAHRMYEESVIIPKYFWNTAKVVMHNDWASLGYYRNQSHYDWRYEGDMFNIYQISPDAYNDLRVSGKAVPEWVQLDMKGTAGEFTAIYGEEPVLDYKRGIYLKYKNILQSNINFFYADHIIPYGTPDERMRTAELSTDFNVKGNTLQVGAMFRPFRIDEEYDYVDAEVPLGTGTNGTQYVIKQDRTKISDAFGGAVKFIMPKTFFGVDLTTLKYTYQGLSAGNKQQLDAEVQQAVTKDITMTLGAMHRKPLLRAVPGVGSTYGPDLIEARGQSQPFWVWWRKPETGWDNRETDEFSLTFVYDTTPETWFFKYEPNNFDEWNLNPAEDALVTFATKVKFTRYLGGTDKQIYVNEKHDTVWEDYSGSAVSGALPTKGYLGSLYFMTRMFLDNDVELLYDFEVGEDVARMSTPYTHTQVFLKEITGYFKTNLTVKKAPYRFKLGYARDAWGPEDWNKDFGATYDELYLAQVSRDIMPCMNVGVDYVGGRKTNLNILQLIDGDTTSRNELGYFDEVRIYARLVFNALFSFGKKERVEPPTAALSLSTDVFMPAKGEKVTLYPKGYAKNGVATWQIKLSDDNRRIVHIIDGTGETPEADLWNGKDFMNKYLPDAYYNAQLFVTDTYGNVAESEICRVRLLTPDLNIEETDEGLRMRFSAKVLFDFDKYNLRDKATKILNEAIRVLKAYPNRNIRVEGHTDNYGTKEYNITLSNRRAQAVSDYLVKNGISAEKITSEGYWFSVPVASNATSAGRQQNRRVEIVILKKGDDGKLKKTRNLME